MIDWKHNKDRDLIGRTIDFLGFNDRLEMTSGFRSFPQVLFLLTSGSLRRVFVLAFAETIVDLPTHTNTHLLSFLLSCPLLRFQHPGSNLNPNP
jgi:hypothetical protein